MQLELMPAFGELNVNAEAIAHGLFYIVVTLAIIYTVIAAYHWLRYGYRSVLTIPALAVHIAVSLALVGYASSGL